jgi:signal transduction histidine kinase
MAGTQEPTPLSKQIYFGTHCSPWRHEPEKHVEPNGLSAYDYQFYPVTSIAKTLSVILPVPDDTLAERRDKFVLGLTFRAIVSCAFAALFLFLTRVAPPPHPPLIVLLSLLVLLGITNILYWSVAARRGFPLRDFYGHWFVDLLLISAIVFCIGGTRVPYVFLAYMMIIVTSATFLSQRASMIVASAATCATLATSWLEVYHFLEPPLLWAAPMTKGTLLMSLSCGILFYYIFAYLAGTLADQLKKANTDLQRARNEIEAQNALLEQKVAERTEQLEKRKAEIEEFVHIVTHDLKNVSVGALETARRLLSMEGQSLRDRARRYVEHLLEDTRRMNEMLIHLLAMFRIDYHQVNGQRVDVGAMATAILRGQARRLEAKRIRANVGELPQVVLDEAQLKHVLTNLIDNAIKYVGDKQQPQISIGSEQRGDEWIISVRDNGVGMRSGQSERIFQLYHRGPDQSVGGVVQKGEGVGLAISKKIVERWGGRIWVESEAQVGSCFSFSVPRVHD